MRQMNRTLTRLSIAVLASLMGLAASAANAEQAAAQIIGRVY